MCLLIILYLNVNFAIIKIGGYMNKKGFTLTEIIGVVIILALIALIAFPSILNLIKGTENKLDSATQLLINTAAKQYMSKYEDNFATISNSTYCIFVDDLVKENFLTPAIVEDKLYLDNKKVKIVINGNNEFSYEVSDECVTSVAQKPVIIVQNRNGIINKNGWINTNFYVDVTALNADGYEYCISDVICEPDTYHSGNGSVLISNQGDNYVCAKATNDIGTSATVCSELYKLDTIAPTVGNINIAGELGENNWYISDVFITVNDDDDSKTEVNIDSITENTSGVDVLVTTYDQAGNSASEIVTLKVDKSSPTIVAKQEIININAYDNNLISNYFDIKYSISGGSVTCDYENTNQLLSLKNTVNCTVKGGNGKQDSASIQINLKGNLIATLKQQYSSSNTVGLLKDSSNTNIYYYKGAESNVSNYLWYGGNLWRILEFDDSNKTLTLITADLITNIYPASSVWTTKAKYESSYANDWLNNVFYNSLKDDIKNNIIPNQFNIGSKTNVSGITTTQNVGLLDYGQYIRTTTDGKDAGATFLKIDQQYALGNYNGSYLVESDRAWGLLDSSTYGIKNYTPTEMEAGIRPVIKINDIVIDTSANGTYASPYRTSDIANNTSSIQVGEYISVPYSGTDGACGSDNICTFRVVSKDADSLKVIYEGSIGEYNYEDDKEGNDTAYALSFFDKVYISRKVAAFVTNITDTYKYTSPKTFNIGYYGAEDKIYDYRNVTSKTGSGYYGLPTVGELYTAGYKEISYWLINQANSYDYVYLQPSIGMGQITSSNNVHKYLYDTRPVMFIKKNLNITSGDGTIQNPYGLD